MIITTNYIRVLVFNKENEEIFKLVRQKLNQSNVPFKLKHESKWEGIRTPKYLDWMSIYVPTDYVELSKSLLAEYTNDSNSTEDTDDYKDNFFLMLKKVLIIERKQNIC